MADMIDTDDTFLEEDLFLKAYINKKDFTKSELITEMKAFNSIVKNEESSNKNQLIQFMIDEIQIESPRVSLIEAVNRSFREACTNTVYEYQARNLSANILRYMDTLKSD